MSERLSAALSYADRGWPVFKLNGKVPTAGSRGFQDATTDAKHVRAWWRKDRANIGIATGPAGKLVLDIDTDHGGEKTLRELERRHGKLPKTVEARTGGGGRHVYFNNVSDAGSSAGRLGKGLDIRGHGGYVVAPPSVHKSGKSYEWINSPEDTDVADPPEWLIELCERDVRERATDWEPEGRKVSPTVRAFLEDGEWEQGEQRAVMCRVTRALLNEGRSTDDIADLIEGALENSAQDADEPWTRRDVEKLVLDLDSKPPPKKREDAAEQPETDPGTVLKDSRVDLVTLIREGIPEREYVPGCEPFLIAGKRYLVPAPAGEGKSLIGLVIAVDVVEAGGTAVVLDVENGSEEYARRLEDILRARDDDGSLAEACVENLRYHAWPAMNTKWSADDWAAANNDVDLVIFDSSRFMLTTAGLKENESDDYAKFVNGLLIPLARTGVTTLVLDNTGHEETQRARGTKAKEDLNEVVYICKVGSAFDRHIRGEARLERTRTRFADLPAVLGVPLGDGVYGPLSVVDVQAEQSDRDSEKAEQVRYAIMLAVRETPGMNKRDLRKSVKGPASDIDQALSTLIKDGRVRVEDGPRNSKLHFPTKADDGDE